MRSLYLLIFFQAVILAQQGGAIYQQRCALCHDHPGPRIPPLSALQAMSGEAVYRALTLGPMKTQAAGLSKQQMLDLIGYIGPRSSSAPVAAISSTCPINKPFSATADAFQWNGWSPSVTNSRYQNAAAAGLSIADLPKLKLRWAFHLGDITEARSQPVIIGGRVFIASSTGLVYSLEAESGCTYWAFQAGPGIRSGVTIGEAAGKAAVFFSDGGANLYALEAATGKLIWKVLPVDHLASLATATPQYYRGVLYQPYSSFEEVLAGDPKYSCCTFRGSIVAIDTMAGHKLWQTFTIPDSARPTVRNAAGSQLLGPSGAGIWSTPTIDEQRNAIYVATGNNYSQPATDTSDAILAFDLKTGHISWSKQLTSEDAYNNACGSPIHGSCPEAHGADSDFGQPPILINLGSNRRALVIAEKSGVVSAIDPDDKGSILWQRRVGSGGPLGGSQWGSATDGQKVYVAIADVGLAGRPDPKSPGGYHLVLDPKKGGGLHALDVKTGKVVWSAPPPVCAPSSTECSPAQSAAVSAASDMVFSGSVDGHLRGYSTRTGAVVWDFDTARSFQTTNSGTAHGGSMDVAGPAVVDGMLLVTSGYGQWGGMPGNVLLAFSTR